MYFVRRSYLPICIHSTWKSLRPEHSYAMGKESSIQLNIHAVMVADL